MRSALTELLRKPKPIEWGTKHTLWVHDDDVSTHELILNPELFPNVKRCVLLTHPKTGQKATLVISSLEPERFGFESREDIYVRPLGSDEIPCVAVVVIRFRDQYIGRLPMRQIKESLRGGGVYVGKRIELPNACVKAKVEALYDVDKKPISSGVVSVDEFTVNFSSETGKVTILIQIAKESLEWDHLTGQTFLDKTIDEFLVELFGKWKNENVNHIVSVLLHTRIIQDGEPRDFYSVAVQWEIHADWRLQLGHIRKEANSLIEATKTGEMVPARDGNFLEAVHLALMIFDKHYIDRDLSKTGMSIISITPGNGHFVVNGAESYTLCRLAKRKVVDDGIWLQLVCLSPPPLYATPLLDLVEPQDRALRDCTPQDCASQDCTPHGCASQDCAARKYYRPSWFNCEYYTGKSQWEKGQCHIPSTLKLYPHQQSSVKDGALYHQLDNVLSDTSLPSLLSSKGASPTTRDSPKNYNPCDPKTTRIRHCQICFLKWSFLVNKTDSEDPLEHSSPNWTTLVTPPCLPLRTGFTLTQETLNKDFELFTEYSIAFAKETLFLKDSPNLNDFKDELVALRIAFGLQVIIGGLDGETKVTLVTGHEIHIIELVSEAVRVQIYTRRAKGFSDTSNSVPYSAHVRPKLHLNYTLCQFDLSPKDTEDYPWEAVDRMIAGDGQREVTKGHSWQSRFILIPAEEAPRSSLIMATAANEILDDEELRIAGFLKFIEVFQRCILSRPSPDSLGHFKFRPPKKVSSKQSSNEALEILLTTSTSSAFAQQEARRIEMLGAIEDVEQDETCNVGEPDRVIDVEPLSMNSTLEHVAVMMQHPLVGISIKNRRWHWKMYKSVFVGSTAVDWMLKFFEDLKSREEAVEYGNRLIDKGIWEHILGTHRFLDGYYYYRFSLDSSIGTLRKSNPKILKTISSREQIQSEEESLQHNEAIRPIIMSRTTVINVDTQQRSVNRREWAFLHYDSTHNPSTTFHFRLHWFTCSSRLVDDLIQSWARRAFQCGFIMLEAPVDVPGLLQISPFHAPLPIEFAALPPRVADLNERLGPNIALPPAFFIEELLRKHGFVLDFESNHAMPDAIPAKDPQWHVLWSYDRKNNPLTQYVHRTGVAIVQIDGDRLLWTLNRLLLASTASRTVRSSQFSQFFPLEAEIRKKLIDFCSDAAQLRDFWQSTLSHLGQKVGIEPILDNIPDDMTEGAEGVVGSPESVFERILAVEDLFQKNL